MTLQMVQTLAVVACDSQTITLIVAVAALVGVGLALKRRAAAKRKDDSERAIGKSTKDLQGAAVDAPNEVAGIAEAEPAPATLKEGLRKTKSEGFVARLAQLFGGEDVGDDILDQVEEVLFTSDIGVRTAERLITRLRETLSPEELGQSEAVWGALRSEAVSILEAAQANDRTHKPSPGTPKVTMVLGVNGTGKTTSIGKLAYRYCQDGKNVTLVAGDTFRAAAAEQLEFWGERVGARVVRGAEGADPASVVFDGLRSAKEEESQEVLVDTAGRLHTQVNLMEELTKVRRVMGKAVEGAPHEVLMVLDATTGQNAIQQAMQFDDATTITGIILTKLDGTAKGGIVIGIGAELGIPIKYIGVGERVADLRDFDAKQFVEELFGVPG